MGWALGWALGARESSPKGGQDILKLRHVDCGLTREMESTGQEAVVRKNRVRCCSQKTQGSFRCPPTGIHPCNNALRSPPYLVDFEVGRSFRGPQFNRDAGEGRGPNDVHVVGRNASQSKPAKFVVFLVKDKGAPRWCRRTKSTFASIRCRKT